MLTHEASLGEDASTSTGTQITADGSPNALGGWTQLGADTTRDAYIFGVVIGSVQQGVGHLVDIGIDPAGGSTYTPIVQQLPVAAANSSSAAGLSFHFFPTGALFVPAGSAVAAKTRASTASATIDVRTLLMSGAPDCGYTWVDTLGADTSDSGGTSIDPGASANTKGAWSTLSASTPYDIDAIVVAVNADAAFTTMSDAEGYIDIAIEVSSTKYVIVGNYPFMQSLSELSASPRVLIPVHIPAGSKVVACAQSSLSTTTRRLFDLSLVCFNRHPLRAT